MSKKRTPSLTPQPGLFDSIDVHALADANTKLQAQVARLKKELAEQKAASQVVNKLRRGVA